MRQVTWICDRCSCYQVREDRPDEWVYAKVTNKSQIPQERDWCASCWRGMRERLPKEA